MKLNYFSEQTLPKMNGGRTSAPRISFSKAGVLVLNQGACELISLKAKDKISLAQDPDHPENWYLFKDKENGYELRAGYKEKGAMLNHRGLCDLILDCFDLPKDQQHNFKIGAATDFGKVKYWGILITAELAE